MLQDGSLDIDIEKTTRYCCEYIVAKYAVWRSKFLRNVIFQRRFDGYGWWPWSSPSSAERVEDVGRYLLLVQAIQGLCCAASLGGIQLLPTVCIGGSSRERDRRLAQTTEAAGKCWPKGLVAAKRTCLQYHPRHPSYGWMSSPKVLLLVKLASKQFAMLPKVARVLFRPGSKQVAVAFSQISITSTLVRHTMRRTTSMVTFRTHCNCLRNATLSGRHSWPCWKMHTQLWAPHAFHISVRTPVASSAAQWTRPTCV